VCSNAQDLLTDLLGPANGVCLKVVANIQPGFAAMFLSNLFEIFVGAVMVRATHVAIRDRIEVLEQMPHEEWTYPEYLVLNQLLVHGAEHHKPQRKPFDWKDYTPKLVVTCRANPTDGLLACLAALNPLSCLCEGVQDISTPLGQDQPKAKNNKWNLPQQSSKWNTPAPSSRWNTPSASQQFRTPSQQQQQYAGYAPSGSGTPSMGMGGASGAYAPQWSNRIDPAHGSSSSGVMQASNPVFAAEQQKRFSVDV